MTQQYNVIVLIFDTLRSDYLGCYGGRSETPNFDSAARDGVLFESAFSTAPGTPVSHASLYTGQYPSEHSVTGQYIDLPHDIPVMAEWFQQAGYDTFGITGPSKMGSDWKYDRGFNELYEPYYDCPPIPSKAGLMKLATDPKFRRYAYRKMTRGGNGHTRLKFDLLKKKVTSGLDRPFFALCNFLTVHAPYDPPRPYKERETPALSRPRFEILNEVLDVESVIDDPDIHMDRISNIEGSDGVGRFLADPSYLNDSEIQWLRDWYTASVRYLDAELGRFLDRYRKQLHDDTILLMTADHGEQLGEHGLWEHSHYFYDETLKIPLIMVGPDIPRGVRRTDLASHVDVFDTLCDLCGLDRPETTSGQSVFSDDKRDAVYMEYGERDLADFANKSFHGRYLDQQQLVEFAAGRKAIRTKSYRFEIDSNGTEKLFAMPEESEVVDPPENVMTRLRQRLRNTLGEEFGIWPEGDPDEIQMTAKAEQNLRELGYIE